MSRLAVALGLIAVPFNKTICIAASKASHQISNHGIRRNRHVDTVKKEVKSCQRSAGPYRSLVGFTIDRGPLTLPSSLAAVLVNCWSSQTTRIVRRLLGVLDWSPWVDGP